MTPKPSAPRRRKPLVAGLGGVALLFAAATAYALLHHPAHRARADLILHRAGYERLNLTITEHGDLESAKNSDIYCRVKAANKGSTISTIIKWVVDDGAEVKGPRPEKPTGDLLVELDDSGFQELLKTQKVTIAQAESNKVQAEQTYRITVSQNEGDIKTARTQVELKTMALVQYTGLSREELGKPEALARLREEVKAEGRDRRTARAIAAEDLKKYKTGDYLTALKDALGQVETAETDLSQQEDREAWVNRMVRKGYQTAKQAEAETALKRTYQLAMNKAALALEVLVKYTKLQTLTQLLTDVEEARRALDRVTAQAHAKEAQTRIDRDTKRAIWELAVSQARDLADEIAKCKIYAPHDGRVLYYLPEQARTGDGSQTSVVAQGEPVREGQKLMQLPDLTHLQVSIRIHEALVTRVRPGQPAEVRMDAYPGRVLHGHVQTVATVALPPSWRYGDVRTYPTTVVIDPEDVAGLDIHPGLTAEVKVFAGEDRPPTLAVPVEALIRGDEPGPECKMFVMTPDGPEERPVKVGASDARVAEIQSGLEEGEEVILNPTALLDDETKAE